jgi:hypothetical protein
MFADSMVPAPPYTFVQIHALLTCARVLRFMHYIYLQDISLHVHACTTYLGVKYPFFFSRFLFPFNI